MAVDGEDDDYMADLSLFLPPQELLKSAQASVCTGVSQEPPQSQGLKKNQRKKQRAELLQRAEEEKRSEGLSAAIPSSNIGFRMLEQMGYRPGKALGKHGQGSLEPLDVDVKRSRSGLGRDEVEKAIEKAKTKAMEISEDAKRRLRKRKTEELESGFRERGKSNWQVFKLQSDYRKARTALHHLEESTTPQKIPPGTIAPQKIPREEEDSEDLGGRRTSQGDVNGDGVEENESDEEIEPQDLLDLLMRLRLEHFYCLYCGCKYEDADSLQASCPGMKEEDH